MPRRTVFLIFALIGATLTAFWWSIDWLTLESLVRHRDDLIDFCGRHMVLAMVTYVSTFILCAALSLPGAASTLTLTAGMVFGLWLGVALSTVAATIGATCAFLIARHLLHDWMHAHFARIFAVIDSGIARDGALYLFMMRLVILFPFFIVNPVMGLTGMRTRTFVAASAAGMLANTFVWVNAGTMLAKFDTLEDVLSWETAAALALIGVLPLILKRLFWRRV